MMADVRQERGRTERVIGREAELDLLLRSAHAARKPGGTRMLLLSGDAGVGKTRLLTEALERLEVDGWTCLVGHCLDLGEGAVPYLPFQEVAERLDRRDLVADGSRGSGVSSGEALDRAQVFEAVHGFLDDLTAHSPVVLVVEDAHWADTSTRDLLSFLLSRRVRGPLLTVVTYRSDELHRRHPLRQRVSEWVRAPGVDRLQLDPLPPGAVRAMVDALIGAVDAPGSDGATAALDDAVSRVVQRAQGNAFYVEELVASLVASFGGGDGRLPEDLTDLLLDRFYRLDKQPRDVTRIASAAGQRVSHELLARVVPLEEGELDDAIRAAIDAHVLVRTGDSEYAFRHALLGEAVYDDLLPGERMRVHTAYAAAVREVLGARGAAALARHALASHDLPTALVASVEAADLAMASGGPDEAVDHLTKALEIHARAAPALEDPPDEAEIVGRAVDALVAAGRPESALTLVDAHLSRMPADTDDLTRARLLLARFEALRSTEAEERPSAVSDEMLGLVGPEPTVLRARMLALHAQALVWDDRFDAARATADEALELAEALDLPRLSADVAMTLTWLSQHEDLGEGSLLELRRIIEEARARGDAQSELRGHLRTGGVEMEHGELARAQASFLDASRVATEMGRPWTIMGVSGRTQAGIAAFMRGEWDEALRIADHAAGDPPPIPRAMLDSVTLLVAAGRGEVERLPLLTSVRERWHREGMVAVNAGGAGIELLARRDGAAAAVTLYDDLVAALAPMWGRHFEASLRLATQALSALVDEAPRTASRQRDDLVAAAARLVADGEAAVRRREHDEQRPFGVEGRAWHQRLGAERLRLDWLLGASVDLGELTDRWRRTAELFGALGHVLEEARARAALSSVLRANGDSEAARVEGDLARAAATRLRAVPLLEQVGSGRESGVDLLTAREHEVLTLVAAGRSNGDIGTQLFISAKTVSVHVSNLMAKLGAGSRTEAVALARQAGLLD